ncbi:MAG: DUF2894 domain-containing protein [Desulfosalsimonadaceae bacterium]|nr:DUF2894 domain-containing protein [Desulfosalsimonadaceae bacterium]
METTGAHQYDPVRFSYIRSMAGRMAGKSESVYTVIERKALTALAEYRTNLESARLEAEKVVDHVCSVFPDAEIEIRGLFKNNEFKKVLQLGRKLHLCHRRTAISGLKDQVRRLTPDSEEKNNPLSVDDLLWQQERDVVASAGNSPTGEDPSQHAGKTELRSLKRFKETMMKLNSDRLVTRSILDLPENSGPHNSQMLATSSLSALRQISPNYLNRFVSHINTLIWLKLAGEDADKCIAKEARKNLSFQ